jgi:hypothetical protein
VNQRIDGFQGHSSLGQPAKWRNAGKLEEFGGKKTAHFDLRLLTEFFFAAILWSVASACRDRYFSSRDDAVKYLRAHEPNFERLAESWASDRPTHPGTFCNFKPDNYRWGGVFIRKVSNRYEVDRGGKKTDFATLEEAQRAAWTCPLN